MSVKEEIEEFVEEFNHLNDWFSQYEFLLEIAGSIPRLEENEKTDNTKLPGCQTDSWIVLAKENGNLHIACDSESLIMRGILGLFVVLLNGHPLSEIRETDLSFPDRTVLREQLSTDRFRSVKRVADRIQKFCREN